MEEPETKFDLVDKDIKDELNNDEMAKRKRCRIIIIVCSLVVIAAIVAVVVILVNNKSDSGSDQGTPDSHTTSDLSSDTDSDSSKGTDEEDDGKLKFLTWEEAHAKAKEKLNEFTMDEKISMLYGTHNMQKATEDGGCVGNIDPIGDKFGGICLQDGPAGVRFSTSTQSWQAGINTASTFNKTLRYEIGKAQGLEFREKGVHVALTPAMNIQRSPQGGRLWESFGDDPFLIGEAASQIIKGVQSNGVIACAKHYIGNDQETEREYSSSNIKEQAFYEIYLEPFYRSVKDAEVGSVMAGYNSLNGTMCVKNKRIVQEILKDKLGYKGFVMSDWWAIKTNESENFNSGVDMNMPGGYGWGTPPGKEYSFWSDFKDRIGDEITNERLDDAVERILASMYKLDQFNQKVAFPEIDLMKNTITEETKKLNREAATQSNVLLKNDNILPIKNMKNKTIAIIGNDAFESPCIREEDCSCKYGDNYIYRGHLALGYGSGTTTFNYTTYPLKAITERAEKEGIEIISSGGITQESKTIDNHVFTVGKEDIETAKQIAEEADLCIVFINADSGERYIELETSHGDRYDLDAWHSGNELVEAVVEKNSNVIVVINSPGPINLPWLDDVKGLIFSGLGGAESGNAIADILFGDYNPSGHLPYVWGLKEDYPAQIDIFSKPDNIEYSEGVFVGQRYFDLHNLNYTFPFGYGLSYTTFEFKKESLEVSMTQEGLKINFEVENTGDLEGEMVPMVFLKFPDSIKTEEGYPEKLFKGFDKKMIKPKESVKFEILVDDHALSYYDIFEGKYVRPNEGKYMVYVGFNAEEYDVLKTEIDAKFE